MLLINALNNGIDCELGGDSGIAGDEESYFVQIGEQFLAELFIVIHLPDSFRDQRFSFFNASMGLSLRMRWVAYNMVMNTTANTLPTAIRML